MKLSLLAAVTRAGSWRRGIVSIVTLAEAVALSYGCCASTYNKPAPTRLWNMTRDTIAKFEMSPKGRTLWGPDQCKNAKDGTVRHRRQLPIYGVGAGTYDARITFASGRICYARNLDVEVGRVFFIEAVDLDDCTTNR